MTYNEWFPSVIGAAAAAAAAAAAVVWLQNTHIHELLIIIKFFALFSPYVKIRGGVVVVLSLAYRIQSLIYFLRDAAAGAERFKTFSWPKFLWGEG